jgi:hypothetical protein
MNIARYIIILYLCRDHRHNIISRGLPRTLCPALFTFIPSLISLVLYHILWLYVNDMNVCNAANDIINNIMQVYDITMDMRLMQLSEHLTHCHCCGQWVGRAACMWCIALKEIAMAQRVTCGVVVRVVCIWHENALLPLFFKFYLHIHQSTTRISI